jgi:hypothetical protein
MYEILTNEGLKEDLRNKNIERALFQLEKQQHGTPMGIDII